MLKSDPADTEKSSFDLAMEFLDGDEDFSDPDQEEQKKKFTKRKVHKSNGDMLTIKTRKMMDRSMHDKIKTPKNCINRLWTEDSEDGKESGVDEDSTNGDLVKGQKYIKSSSSTHFKKSYMTVHKASAGAKAS